MITLEMINHVEKDYGGLYKIAEDLLQNALPRAVVEDILRIFGIEDFHGEEPEAIFTTVLLNILEEMEKE